MSSFHRRLAALNLNHLVALDALLEERHVSRAARRVGVSQSAMSQSLARLRQLFDDPLLIREGRGMAPTAKARALAEPLRASLERMERTLSGVLEFDPAETERSFRLALPDHLAASLTGPLATDLAARAPSLRFAVVAPLGWDPRAALAAGGMDMAVGGMFAHHDDLLRERLFDERFVCLIREDHPERRDRFDFDTYRRLRHLTNARGGRLPRAMTELGERLAMMEIDYVSVPYQLAIPMIVRSSDLVATVPSRLAALYAELPGLAVVESPAELPRFPIEAIWHRRHDHDRGHRWFRQRVREVVAADSPHEHVTP